MALTTSRTIVAAFLLVALLVPVAPSSLSLDMMNEEYLNSLVRQRRQTSIPTLFTQLGVFVGQLLNFVSYLLTVLGNALPIILGALGLGGLGLALDTIVTELAIVVSLLSSGRKRRAIASVPISTVDAQLAAAQKAVTTVNSLTSVANKLNQATTLKNIQSQLLILQTDLKNTSTPLTTIQSILNNILTNLISALTQIQTTTNSLTSKVQPNLQTIILALNLPSAYLLGLGSQLSSVLTPVGTAAIGLIVGNVTSAENIALTSLITIDQQLSSITNATVNALLSSTQQLGLTITKTITQCA